MGDYNLFLSATDKKIADKSKMRVDLLGDMKIKDIEELKDFKILYVSQGHEDLVSIKDKEVPRKVRYIQVFKRQFHLLKGGDWVKKKKKKKNKIGTDKLIILLTALVNLVIAIINLISLLNKQDSQGRVYPPPVPKSFFFNNNKLLRGYK